jgi:hypothetical protein
MRQEATRGKSALPAAHTEVAFGLGTILGG